MKIMGSEKVWAPCRVYSRHRPLWEAVTKRRLNSVSLKGFERPESFLRSFTRVLIDPPALIFAHWHPAMIVLYSTGVLLDVCSYR